LCLHVVYRALAPRLPVFLPGQTDPVEVGRSLIFFAFRKDPCVGIRVGRRCIIHRHPDRHRNKQPFLPVYFTHLLKLVLSFLSARSIESTCEICLFATSLIARLYTFFAFFLLCFLLPAV